MVGEQCTYSNILAEWEPLAVFFFIFKMWHPLYIFPFIFALLINSRIWTQIVGIWTQIVGVEGEQADHFTTTTTTVPIISFLRQNESD